MIKYLVAAVLPLWAFSGCSDDKSGEQTERMEIKRENEPLTEQSDQEIYPEEINPRHHLMRNESFQKLVKQLNAEKLEPAIYNEVLSRDYEAAHPRPNEDPPSAEDAEKARLFTTIDSAKVSSTQEPIEGEVFESAFMCDGQLETAWAEGKLGYGLGEKITITMPPGVFSIGFANGLQKSDETYRRFSRVQRFKAIVNGESVCYINLEDIRQRQFFDLIFPEGMLEQLASPEGEAVPYELTLQIVHVYPGAGNKFTSISDIYTLAGSGN